VRTRSFVILPLSLLLRENLQSAEERSDGTNSRACRSPNVIASSYSTFLLAGVVQADIHQ